MIGQVERAKTLAVHRERSRHTEETYLLLALLTLDALAIAAGFWIAYLIRFRTNIPFFEADAFPKPEFYRILVLALIPAWILVFAIFQLYDRDHLLEGTEEYTHIVNASASGMMLVIFASFVAPEFVIARAWLFLSWVLIIACVSITRFGVRRVIHSLRARGMFMRPAIIIGANAEGQAIAAQLACAHYTGLQIVGFLDDERPLNEEVTPGLRVLGTTDALEKLVASRGLSELIVVSSAISRERLLNIFQTFGTLKDVTLRMSSGLYEILTTGMQVREFACVPLMNINRVRLTGLDAFLKAVLDYSVSLLGILILSPVLLIVAILIKVDSPGPVLYRRRVIGIGGREFDAFKFRTMVVNADAVLATNSALRSRFAENFKLKEDPRVTRVGRFLRRTSIDELPQLFNVLRGEMSLVGPRMITPEEQKRYGKWETNLLTVKPGITGLWQVSGRSNLSYIERVNLDMYYIRNYTIWLDLRLLLQTIPAVLRGVGAY